MQPENRQDVQGETGLQRTYERAHLYYRNKEGRELDLKDRTLGLEKSKFTLQVVGLRDFFLFL